MIMGRDLRLAFRLSNRNDSCVSFQDDLDDSMTVQLQRFYPLHQTNKSKQQRSVNIHIEKQYENQVDDWQNFLQCV